MSQIELYYCQVTKTHYYNGRGRLCEKPGLPPYLVNTEQESINLYRKHSRQRNTIYRLTSPHLVTSHIVGKSNKLDRKSFNWVKNHLKNRCGKDENGNIQLMSPLGALNISTLTTDSGILTGSSQSDTNTDSQ